MIKRIKAHTITCCDFCGREALLSTCIVCGKRFCLSCDAIIPGCMVQPNCCIGCSHNQKVIEICDRYAQPIQKLVERRDKALKNAK